MYCKDCGDKLEEPVVKKIKFLKETKLPMGVMTRGVMTRYLCDNCIPRIGQHIVVDDIGNYIDYEFEIFPHHGQVITYNDTKYKITEITEERGSARFGQTYISITVTDIDRYYKKMYINALDL